MMKIWRNSGGALLALLFVAGAAARADEAPLPAAPASREAVAASETMAGPGWSLRLPPDDIVVYRGEVNFDQAGGKGQAMLYPGGFGAAGLIGLVAGVATHAVVESSIRSRQKSKIQQRADMVLVQYHDVLQAYDEKDLYTHAVPYMRAAGGKTVVPSSQEVSDGRMVITDPVFSIAQDSSAIVLEAAVAIYPPGAQGEDAKPAYQNTVRVVSAPRVEADPAIFWLANGGEALKDQSAQLFARALDLAIEDMGQQQGHGDAPVYKSIHYADGRADKVERGQVIAETADGTVLRNLRGWIMAVPPRPAPQPAVVPAEEPVPAASAPTPAVMAPAVTPAPAATIPAAPST